MKVIFITPYMPLQDGIARYSQLLIEGMRSVAPDFKISIVAWNYPKKLNRLLAPILRWFILVGPLLATDVVHIQFVASWYLWHLLPALWITRLFRSKSRIVLTLHETNDNTSPRWLFDLLQQWHCNVASKIIVHSKYHLGLLNQQLRRKAVVVPMAVPATGELTLPRKPHTMLLPGFINPWKGHDLAIHAIAKLLSQFPDAKLRIVGQAHNQAFLDELHELTKALGVTNAVIFQDRFVDNSDFNQAFATAGLVLLPYRRIAMSAVLAQAIACVSPTIMSNLEPLREYTQNQGIYFQVGDANDLAKVIAMVWSDPSHLQRNIHLFGTLRELYRSQSVANITIGVYQSLF